MNFKNYDDLGFLGAFSAGFGLKHSGLSLDYAFCPYGDLGTAHRLTAGLRWGGAARPAPNARPRRRGKRCRRWPWGPSPSWAAPAPRRRDRPQLRGIGLVKTGRFRLVERSSAEFLLKEKRLAASGLTGERLAAELGVFTGADAAVFGSVLQDNSGYLLTARLVESATGEILRSESAQAKEVYLFRDAARRLAAALAAD
jgi:hypothetical protein